MERFRLVTPLLAAAAAGDDAAAAATESAPARPSWTLHQAVAGVIGFKLYPGALLMMAWLEAQARAAPPLPSPAAAVPPPAPALPRLADLAAADAPSTVLELGAGVTGLAALGVAALGYTALATDLPAVVPSLADNLARNAGELRGVASAAPLSWGDAAAATDLLETCRAAGRPVRLILGADIVYHEHLVDPLLATLTALTEPPPDGSPPPAILLTYVQRFKRAKAFFHKAAKAFDVVRVPLGEVVEYDCLSWVLPTLLAPPATASAAGGGGDSTDVEVDSTWAAYDTFRDALLRHAAAGTLADVWARRAGGDGSCDGGSGGGGDEGAATSGVAPAVVHHGVDTDSDTDKTFHDLFGATAAEALFAAPGGAGAGAGADAPAPPPPTPQAAAHAAALAAGIPFAEPLQAAGYLLRRRPAGSARAPRTRS